jgi:hypothetical protein
MRGKWAATEKHYGGRSHVQTSLVLGLVMLGNAAAIREVCERIDGKVKDEVEMDVSVNLRRVQFMTDAELEEQARKVIDITATATSKDDADDTGGDHDGGK